MSDVNNELAFSLLVSQLSITNDLQQLFRPNDTEFNRTLAFPNRYDVITPDADYTSLQAICKFGVSVIIILTYTISY